MGIQLDLKNISTDELLVNELIEKGEGQQVPFLVDTDRDVQMYGSGEIISYLAEHYGPVDGTSEAHVAGAVCESCQ